MKPGQEKTREERKRVNKAGEGGRKRGQDKDESLRKGKKKEIEKRREDDRIKRMERRQRREEATKRVLGDREFYPSI